MKLAVLRKILHMRALVMALLTGRLEGCRPAGRSFQEAHTGLRKIHRSWLLLGLKFYWTKS
jgi:hypothetical protein